MTSTGLSKGQTGLSNTKVDRLIVPDESRKIDMGIHHGAIKLIMDRLTDLYPNPAIAAVREVVSNAMDATTLVQDKKPVEITSPSTFNPVFIVTDHGIGMSAEDVELIYSQYGASTKATDFNQLGAYGLGAKAPLAYCNSFNVTTSKNGITTEFTVAREEVGNVTEILSIEETGKSNGTTVTIPVKTADVKEFRDAIDSYRKFASDIELIIDGTPVKIADEYIQFDDILLDDASQTFGRVWMSRMGHDTGYSYISEILTKGTASIYVDYVLQGWLYSGSDAFYRNGYTPSIIVELKPGVVDFTSSRDAITRNDRFKDLNSRVHAKFSKINDDLIVKIMSFYRELSDVEAWNVYSKLCVALNDDNTVGLQFNRSYYVQNFATDPVLNIAISEFTTKTGYNPVEVFMDKSRKGKIFGIVPMTGENGKHYGFYHMIESKYRNQLHASKTIKSGKYGEVSEGIIAAVANDESMDFVNSMMGWGDNRRDVPDTVIVNGVTPEFALQFTRKRLSLWKHVFKDKFVVLAKNRVPASEIELVKAHPMWAKSEITQVKAVDVFKDLQVAVKAARAAKVKAPVTENKVRVFKYSTGLSARADFDSISRPVDLEVTISDLVNENALIFFGRNDWSKVLKGASNNGVDIYNKPIYVISEDRRFGLRAEHFNTLNGYGHVYASPEFSYPAKIVDTVLDGRRYASDVFKEDADLYTTDQLVNAYITSQRAFSSTYRASTFKVLNAVIEKFADDSVREIFNLIRACENESSTIYNSHRQNYYFAEEFLRARLDENTFNDLLKAIAVIDEVQYYTYNNTFDESIVAQLFNGREIEGSKMYGVVVDMAAEMIESKFLAGAVN